MPLVIIISRNCWVICRHMFGITTNCQLFRRPLLIIFPQATVRVPVTPQGYQHHNSRCGGYMLTSHS